MNPAAAMPNGDTMTFRRPGPAERVSAVGRVSVLPSPVRRVFELADGYRPLPPPRASDWLSVHPERGQSYEAWVRSPAAVPTNERTRMYVQPLGTLDSRTPSLGHVRDFARAYFGLEVVVLEALDLASLTLTTRRHPTEGHRQICSADLLALLAGRLPDDAACMLGVTTTDLYPDPRWSFVFGQASLRARVGVCSFARYDPRFYGERWTDDARRRILHRGCKVLAHETGHMLGIHHCVFYHCVMNGSNNLEESDARPLEPCPIDLRKLHHATDIDPIERWRRLSAVCRELGFEQDAAWYEGKMAQLG